MPKPKTFSVVHRTDTSLTSPYGGTADQVVEWLKRCSDVSKYMIFDGSLPLGNQYMNVETFLQRNIIPEIFSQLVPKYYVMDPETEDMVPNGKHLANGMKVLIADPDQRERPEKLGVHELGVTQDWLRQKLLDRNRWCTVSHIEISNHGQTVSFVGIYEDGTKAKYIMGIGYAWLVKSDSIVESNQKAIEDHAKVQDLVQEAMTTAVKVVTGEASDEDKADQLTDTIRKTTTQILGTIG